MRGVEKGEQGEGEGGGGGAGPEEDMWGLVRPSLLGVPLLLPSCRAPPAGRAPLLLLLQPCLTELCAAAQLPINRPQPPLNRPSPCPLEPARVRPQALHAGHGCVHALLPGCCAAPAPPASLAARAGQRRPADLACPLLPPSPEDVVGYRQPLRSETAHMIKAASYMQALPGQEAEAPAAPAGGEEP